ncbi:MAG TPA: pseudouridine synthase [Pirellulales bacterium]|jgi:23S rRNA pseudouridine2605 synthase
MTRADRPRASGHKASANAIPEGDAGDSSSSPGAEVRLQKVMASAGVGSRRHCEELITTGRVDVDGKTVTALGTKVSPDQQVRVDGVALAKSQHVYYLVYKPVGVVSTNSDPSGRPRVLDLLPPMTERLFTVGRLDMSSEGLILLTNDGELANRLAHPRYEIEKTYLAVVAGSLEPDALETLRRGVHLAEGFARVDGVRVKKIQKNGTLLEIVLSEGKNREIRRVLAKVGHKVLQLKRVAIAGLKLADMAPGEYRRVSPAEVRALRKYRPGQLLEKFNAAAAAGPKGPEGKRTPKHASRPGGAPVRRSKPADGEESSAKSFTRGERGPRPGGARPAGARPNKTRFGKSAGSKRPIGAGAGKPPYGSGGRPQRGDGAQRGDATTSRPPRSRPPRTETPRHGTVIGEVAGPAAAPEPVVREGRPPRGPGGRPARGDRSVYAGPGGKPGGGPKPYGGARPSGAGRTVGGRPGVGRPGGGKPAGGRTGDGRPAGRPGGGKQRGVSGQGSGGGQGGGGYRGGGKQGGAGRPPRGGPGKGKRR